MIKKLYYIELNYFKKNFFFIIYNILIFLYYKKYANILL